MPKVARWYALALLLVVLDQLSKYWISTGMRYGDARAITGFFNLVLTHNQGAAFSFLASAGGWQRGFFIVIALAAIVLISVLIARHGGEKLFCFAMALILGGAMGNVIDRILFGHVIDFLDFHWQSWGHFPAFNIADSAISIGAVLFIIDELRRVNE